MRFTEAFCTTASCSASRSVILTGRFNQRTAQHGHIHGYHHFRTYRDVRLLPVRLSERGYSTARIGKFFVAPESVYRFDVKPDDDPKHPLPKMAPNLVSMAEARRKFLSIRDNRGFFLYFCTSDPHCGGGRAEGVSHFPDRFGNSLVGGDVMVSN